MANMTVFNQHFNLLEEVMAKLNLRNKPKSIFNCDKSMVAMHRRTRKVVVSRNTKQAYCETKGMRDHITMNTCVSTSDMILPPHIKFNSPSHQVHMEEMDLTVPYTLSHLIVVWTHNYFMVSLTNSSSFKHSILKDQNFSYLMVMVPTFQQIQSTCAEETTYICIACHPTQLMYSNHWMLSFSTS